MNNFAVFFTSGWMVEDSAVLYYIINLNICNHKNPPNDNVTRY